MHTRFDIPGDFDLESQESDHVVCVENVVDFTSAFLFSVETQHTIGWVEKIRLKVDLYLLFLF